MSPVAAPSDRRFRRAHVKPGRKRELNETEVYAPNAALFDAMATTAGTRVLTFASELIEHEALLALILSAVDGGADNHPDVPVR